MPIVNSQPPPRRQYLDHEAAYTRKGVFVKAEEGPLGPSPDTVLTGFRGAPATPPPPTAASKRATLVPPSRLLEFEAASKAMPARVRASPDFMRRSPTPTQQTTQRPTATPSDDRNTAATPVSFEEEIMHIGRLNNVLPTKANSSTVPPRSTSRMAADASRGLTSTSAMSVRPHSQLSGGKASPAFSDYSATLDGLDATGGVGKPTFYEPEAPAAEEDEHVNRTATGKVLNVPYAPDLRPQVGGNGAKMPRKPLVLQDYKMIADACQRAGQVRMEGHAYFKVGELLARNRRDTLHQSIPYFKRFLSISRRLKDVQGEGKALNVLGNTFYFLMNTDPTTHTMNGRSREEILRMAAEFHQQHAEVADAAGLFIANTNLGVVYRALGEDGAALDAFKAALQYAVRAGDKAAEALALSNLSEVEGEVGDGQTAQVCLERNLEIAAATHNSRVECESHAQLAALAAKRGDYSSATESYLLALDVAMSEGDSEKAAEIRCEIGVVQGLMRMGDQMHRIAERMKPRATK